MNPRPERSVFEAVSDNRLSHTHFRVLFGIAAAAIHERVGRNPALKDAMLFYGAAADRRLSDVATRVLVAAFARMIEPLTGATLASNHDLARAACCTPQLVKRSLAELEAARYIRIVFDATAKGPSRKILFSTPLPDGFRLIDDPERKDAHETRD